MYQIESKHKNKWNVWNLYTNFSHTIKIYVDTNEGLAYSKLQEINENITTLLDCYSCNHFAPEKMFSNICKKKNALTLNGCVPNTGGTQITVQILNLIS